MWLLLFIRTAAKDLLVVDSLGTHVVTAALNGNTEGHESTLAVRRFGRAQVLAHLLAKGRVDL